MSNNDTRATYLKTICNCNNLPTNVVVSAIQGLYHVANRRDEEVLFPLLECTNLSIAGAALVSLYANFHAVDQIREKIVQLASTYGNNEESCDLQLKAINILEDLAINDNSILKELISIAENFQDIIPASDTASVNAQVWKILANRFGEKLKTDDFNELVWNLHSTRCVEIRNAIRASIRPAEESIAQPRKRVQ